jgi:hypothetical protein
MCSTELAKQEAELAALKKKWESVIQREMAASTTSASSSSNLHTSPAAQSTSIFSTLASTLNASAGQSPVKSLTGSGQDATSSPSTRAQSNSGGSRRLLTNRHSISVSPASSSQIPPYFGGGSDLSPQTSPSPINESNQQVAPLDVQKLAKSWLGGVMKSATTVLDSLAPPPSSQDLGTVAEEDEEEEEEEEQRDGHGHRRTTASHPNSVARSRSPHDRNGSTATVLSEMSSPSSSCEDGQFSSAASRSSSVSSLHSENGKHDSNDRDITPVATPVLPHDTPRANGSTNSNTEEGDLWALNGGEFEDSHDRERREDMERDRLSSPPQGGTEASPRSAAAAAPRRPANHGRRRSTAFELGGAWGAMVGKKWSEVTSQLSASETFKTSSKKAMGIMEGFERSLSEAITPDANDANASNNTQLMLVNGELIPTGDWSPVSSPRQEQKENGRDRDSLPSGIGGPASWSALLARTNSRSSNSSSSNNSRSTRAEQQEQWMNHDDLLSGDLGQNTLSPSSNTSARLSRSLLDDDNDEYVGDSQTQQQQRSATLSPTPTTAQERLQASRAKHAKRMSMPVNSMSASAAHPLASPQPRGLGLENVNETEEDNDAWGW